MKHFLKALFAFIAIIVLALIGLVLVNYFEQNGGDATASSSPTQVAK
jgi:preprotein translocase subunit SecG